MEKLNENIGVEKQEIMVIEMRSLFIEVLLKKNPTGKQDAGGHVSEIYDNF